MSNKQTRTSAAEGRDRRWLADGGSRPKHAPIVASSPANRRRSGRLSQLARCNYLRGFTHVLGNCFHLLPATSSGIVMINGSLGFSGGIFSNFQEEIGVALDPGSLGARSLTVAVGIGSIDPNRRCAGAVVAPCGTANTWGRNAKRTRRQTPCFAAQCRRAFRGR